MNSSQPPNWTSMYPCCASFGFHFNIIHCYEHKVCSVLLKSRADRPKAGLSGENFIPVCWWKPWWNLPRDLNFKGGGLRILVGLFSRPLQLPGELGIVCGVLGRLGRAGWAGPNSQHTVNTTINMQRNSNYLYKWSWSVYFLVAVGEGYIR